LTTLHNPNKNKNGPLRGLLQTRLTINQEKFGLSSVKEFPEK